MFLVRKGGKGRERPIHYVAKKELSTWIDVGWSTEARWNRRNDDFVRIEWMLPGKPRRPA